MLDLQGNGKSFGFKATILDNSQKETQKNVVQERGSLKSELSLTQIEQI